MHEIYMWLSMLWLVYLLARIFKPRPVQTIIFPQPPPLPVTPVTITLRGQLGKNIADGKALVLAVIVLLPDSNELSIVFPDSMVPEEGTAMLKKFIPELRLP